MRDFLLAWQHAPSLGGWDITRLWNLDSWFAGDLVTVFHMIARGPNGFYPAHYGYEAEIRELAERFRPGEERSERCERCGVDVRHRCDAEGHRQHLAEVRAEEERERWIETAPNGHCSRCDMTLDRDDAGPVCRWCRDDERAGTR